MAGALAIRPPRGAPRRKSLSHEELVRTIAATARYVMASLNVVSRSRNVTASDRDSLKLDSSSHVSIPSGKRTQVGPWPRTQGYCRWGTAREAESRFSRLPVRPFRFDMGGLRCQISAIALRIASTRDHSGFVGRFQTDTSDDVAHTPHAAVQEPERSQKSHSSGRRSVARTGWRSRSITGSREGS